MANPAHGGFFNISRKYKLPPVYVQLSGTQNRGHLEKNNSVLHRSIPTNKVKKRPSAPRAVKSEPATTTNPIQTITATKSEPNLISETKPSSGPETPRSSSSERPDLAWTTKSIKLYLCMRERN